MIINSDIYCPLFSEDNKTKYVAYVSNPYKLGVFGEIKNDSKCVITMNPRAIIELGLEHFQEIGLEDIWHSCNIIDLRS
jgi:hypothetical protein